MFAARGKKLITPWVTNLARVSSTSVLNFARCGQYHVHTSPVHFFPRCELTSLRYEVERGQFSQVSATDVNFFTDLLGPHRIVIGERDLEGHNTDWLGMVRGASSVLVKPKTTEEVSKILAYCNQHHLAVCPQGGNTGLVGGSVPVFDEIIVSTALMKEVEKVDTWSGVVTCQAGCVLEALDQHVAEYGLMVPLDLGAKGSCHIGGNISTNAGGLRLVRYGNLHGSVLGVEAVLASGEIVDCLSAMKKDNTGYALKHLFIGSEGTLGFITKVAINCPPRPQAVNLAFLGLQTFDDVLKTYKDAKNKLGEILSSCEFIDQSSLECVEENLKLKGPIDAHPFYMLIETSGSNGAHDEEKLNTFLEDVLESGRVTDGTVASEPSRMLHIWSIRERIAEALICDGYTYKSVSVYDISLPLPHFYKMVEDMREHLGSSIVRCCGYGHIGDGNLHLNITSKEFEKVWLTLVVVVAAASEAQAQFRFPTLPSPPDIIFGAFRPLFARARLRPRPRPRPRPPILVPASQFLQQQNQRPPPPVLPQVFRPQPPPQPPPQQIVALAPPPPTRPSPPIPRPRPQPQPQPLPQPQQRPPPDLSGFGSPRPESLLNAPRPQPQPPRPQQQQPLRPQPPPPQQTFSPSQSFPAPLFGPSDNNIIGMVPPPPPSPPPSPRPTSLRPIPRPPPSTPPPRPSTFQTPSPVTSLPVGPITPPSSNSVDDLLVNPVPAVNAGVLPLANEKPSEPQLFPPLADFA